MFKKILFASLFLSASLALADTTTETTTANAQDESKMEQFLDKSGEVIHKGAEKTKDFGKKAASATKKTWNDAVDGTKEFFHKFGDKEDNKFCEKKKGACSSSDGGEKSDCACKCKCGCNKGS